MNDRPITRRPPAPCWRSRLGLALVVLLATACSDQADYPYYMEGSCSEAASGAACGTQAASGGEGVTENGYDFGRPGGTFTLTWEAYGVPDRFEVIYERKVLFDTGSVSGSGSRQIRYCGKAKSVTVRVSGPVGTAWNYSVSCP